MTTEGVSRHVTVKTLGRYVDVLTFDLVAGYWRNVARAQRVIDFIEQLTIPSGAGVGGPFVLREWQRKFVRDIYEPCDEAGRRVVRDAVLSMGRKNGKTAVIAALVLVHLVGPEAVMNGEIYSAANDREQAAVVFKFACQFIQADAELDATQGGALTIIESKKRIMCRANGSFYRALSREAGTKHGLNPSFVIYDELAQAKDRELYDTLNTAMGARDEPLFAVISTQSRDPQHILSELIDRGLEAFDATVVCHLYAVPDEVADEQLYCPSCAVRFDIDKDADDTSCPTCGGDTLLGIFDEAVWKMANPALGDFLSLDSVRKLAKQALDSVSFMPSFQNLSLNQRVDAAPGIISRADWKACRTPSAVLRPGEDIYLGLDLSATTDLCALGAVSATDGDRVAAWCWKPRDLLKLHATRDRAPYEKWALEGWLQTPPGRDVDYDHVAHHIFMISLTYNILGIAYDRWRMAVLMKCFDRLGIPAYYDGTDEADRDGIRFVEWGQGFKDMAPAVDALDKAVAARTLGHTGNPLLTWCMSNAVVSFDAAGNRKLDKSKPRFRIDPAVAITQAIGLKVRDTMDDDGNFNSFLGNPISVRA